MEMLISVTIDSMVLVVIISFSFGANATHLIAHRLALSHDDSCLNRNVHLPSIILFQWYVFFSLKLILI